MKLHQLRSFEAIARNDFSVTRAAEDLHATQPGVTKHVQLLESELGVALFVRHKRRFLGLTSAGKAILPMAKQAVQALEALQRTARHFADNRVRTLTVATSPTPARVFFPPLIQRFGELHPNTRLRLMSGTVGHSIDAVLRGDADFCLCSAPRAAAEDIAFYPCYEHRWLLVAPPGHELLTHPKLSIRDIARYRLITYEEGYASRNVIADAFARHGLTPDIVLDTADGDTMRRYVASGLGVAIVGGSTFEITPESGLSAIDLSALVPSVRMHVGIARRSALSEDAVQFIGLIKPDLLTEIAAAGAPSVPGA